MSPNCDPSAHALPMFREPRQRSTRKQLEKDRLDPMKSHKPEPPVAGAGNIGIILLDCCMPKGPSFFGSTLIWICIVWVVNLRRRCMDSVQHFKTLMSHWSACLQKISNYNGLFWVTYSVKHPPKCSPKSNPSCGIK